MIITKEDVGKKVWSFKFGWGIIKYFNDGEAYPVLVDFVKTEEAYTSAGKEAERDEHPSIVWQEFEIPAAAFEKLRWRAEGAGRYYYISLCGGSFRTDETFEANTKFDNRLYESFNYYRTEVEAEKKLAEIRKVLKGNDE